MCGWPRVERCATVDLQFVCHLQDTKLDVLNILANVAIGSKAAVAEARTALQGVSEWFDEYMAQEETTGGQVTYNSSFSVCASCRTGFLLFGMYAVEEACAVECLKHHLLRLLRVQCRINALFLPVYCTF